MGIQFFGKIFLEDKQKMRRIICLIAVVLIAAMVFGQEEQQPNLPEQASEVASEEIEWVWKKDFPEEIQDIVVDMKKVRRKIMKDNKEVEIEEETIFPKVVVTEREGGVKGAKIRFYDKDGRMKKEYSSRPTGTLLIIKTKNDKFIAKIELNMEGILSDIYPGELEVYNNEGNIIWRRIGNIPYNIAISPDGKYAVGVGGGPAIEALTDNLYILYPDKETKSIKLNIDNMSDSYNIDFTDKGDYFVIIVGEPAVLILFNKIGSEIWKKNLKGTLGKVAFSPNGKYIVAEAGYTSYLFKISGELICEIPFWGHTYRFSKNGRYMIILNESYSVPTLFWIIEIETGKVITQCEKGELFGYCPYGIIDVYISPNFEFIVAGARNKGKIKVFNFYGKIVSECVLGVNERYWWHSFGEDIKTVYLSSDGGKMFILMKDGIKQLKIK
jgi:WD40 repeat protein